MFDVKKSLYRINSFSDSSEIISIIIKRMNEEQLHIGIAFKNKGNFNAVHLAWHFDLRHVTNISGLSDYYWIKSKIHKTRQKSISQMCRKVIERNSNQQIPYGVLFSGGKFTKDGLLELNEKEHGLTCATFVMAVFEGCGFKLINILNWDVREEDIIWHGKIMQNLNEYKIDYNISDDHIKNVESEKGCSRFKPEEVAVSSTFKKIPESKENIRNCGKILERAL